MKKNILITGASGFLGFYCCLELHHDYQIAAAYCRAPLPRLDFLRWCPSNLLELGEIRPWLAALGRVDMVLHLAAYANIDFCERFPALSRRLNAESAKLIAQFCEEKQIPMLAVSTDLVFSGEDAPYAEGDFCYPRSYYARQKVEMEEFLLSKKGCFVVRLPLLYGLGLSHGNFFNTWISKLQQGEQVEAFSDEYRSPLSGATAAAWLKSYIDWIFERQQGAEFARNAHWEGNKLLHFGSDFSLSRYDFGLEMCQHLGLNQRFLQPTLLKNHKLAALRPADVSLDNQKGKDLLRFQPPSLNQELSEIASLWRPPTA